MALLCLRSDVNKEAGTVVADIQEACIKLSEDELQLLRSKSFIITPPESFFQGRATEVIVNSPVPLISGPFEYPTACLDFNPGVVELHSGQSESDGRLLNDAVTALEVSLVSVSRTIYLEPGDLLLISNSQAVHGRTGFKASLRGGDRWLQRVYVKSDLWSSPLDPAYPGRTLRGDILK